MPRTRILRVPSPCLVVMVGPAGSGKSSFCRRSFRPAEIVSTDACRLLLAGDEADQGESPGAFLLAHRMAEQRLGRGLLTVFDATSVEPRARRALVALSARRHVPAIAIVLDLPVETCVANDRRRARRVGRAVIVDQARRLARGLPRLRSEGFAAVHIVRGRSTSSATSTAAPTSSSGFSSGSATAGRRPAPRSATPGDGGPCSSATSWTADLTSCGRRASSCA